MIVEALINLKEPDKEMSFSAGDIITLQPANTLWGKGDLKCRIVVQIDLPDFPCGNEFMKTIRCSQCEHQGIDWASESLTVGEIAPPKLTCPKEVYTSPDVDYVFTLSDKGLPGVTSDLKVLRRAKLVLDNVLSPESTVDYLLETDLTEAEKDAKLAITRKESNLVTVSSLIVKSEMVVKDEPTIK